MNITPKIEYDRGHLDGVAGRANFSGPGGYTEQFISENQAVAIASALGIELSIDGATVLYPRPSEIA